jgi:hypothetical protein
LVFPIGIIEVSATRNDVFYFISVPYTITNLLAPKTLYYILRGAKWSDVKNVISAPQNAKKEIQLKHKNQVPNSHFIES